MKNHQSIENHKSIAVNVLSIELEAVRRNVLFLNNCLNKAKVESIPIPNAGIRRHVELRWRRSLKDQINKGTALIEAIKILEEHF